MRRQAGSGQLRRRGRGGGGGAPRGTALTVLGANLAFYLRADTGYSIGTGVSSLADLTGNLTVTQGTSTKQPAWEATGWNGVKPSILFDGSNDRLIGTLTSGFPIGSRAWMWAIAQRVGGTSKYFASIVDSGGGVASFLCLLYNATNYSAWRGDGPLFEQAIGPALDTNRKRFEVGHTAGGTGTLVVDGTAYNTVIANATNTAMAIVELGCINNATFANTRIAEVGGAFAVPSAGVQTQLRAISLAEYGS